MNFTHYIITKDRKKIGTNQIVIMSEDHTNKHYELHFFDISNELSWKSKLVLDFGVYQLRYEDSIFRSDIKSIYLFIDSSSYKIFCYYVNNEQIREKIDYSSINQNREDKSYLFQTILTDYPISKIYHCCNGIVIVLYKKNTIISFYKVYIDSFRDKPDKYYSVEFMRNQMYNNTIVTISVLHKNMILFTQPTKVSLWKITSNSSFVFQKNLPFFHYANLYEFSVDSKTGHVVEAIENNFMFVVMEKINNPSDKLLFCFYLDTNKHDSLHSIIPLNKQLSALENSVFTESNMYYSSIFLYMFYGDKKYQFISFVPYNMLTETSNKTGNLFLPKECIQEDQSDSQTVTDPQCVKIYKDRTVNLTIYPLSMIQDNNHKLTDEANVVNYTINCKNIGFKIDRIQNSNIDLVLNPEEGVAKISLLDYFTGFNNSYSIEHASGAENSRTLFDYKFSDNSASTIMLESVKAENMVFYSFEYMDKYLLLFFDGDQHVLQVYRIDEDVQKLEMEFNHFELFDSCVIDHINFKKISEFDQFLIMTCKDPSNQIRAAYFVKLFRIMAVLDDSIALSFIDTTMIAHKVIESDMIKTLIDPLSYYIVFYSKSNEDINSVIYFVTMNCTNMVCKFDEYKVLNAEQLGMDSFVSNSFLFIPNQPLFIAAKDDFGLIVINLFSWRVIETIAIKEYIALNADTFNIYQITVLNENSLRVFLYNIGSFSFLWKDIRRIFSPAFNSDEEVIHIKSQVNSKENSIFKSLTIDDIVLETIYEIDTNYISNTHSGYTQIIYYQESENFYTAYVRVYNLYNKDKSKILSEFSIGKVASCSSMITDVIENGFILKTYVICGSTLYLNQVNLYPELKIIDLYPDKDLAPCKYDKHLLCSYSVDFNITTWNQNSKAKLKASVQYEHVRNTFPIIYIVIGYVSFQAITAFVIFKVCSWIINSKSQEMKDYEQQQNDARSRDFKSKFKTYFSTPNLDETEPLIIEKCNSDYIESIISNKYNRKYNNSYHEGSIQSKEKKPLLNKKIYRVRFFDEENSD